jgi:hypothetical protein
MRKAVWSCLLILSALPLIAADTSWKSKPLSAWSTEDGNQVLSDSAWVQVARVATLPERGEAQLRDGGKMGGSGKRAGLRKFGTLPTALQVRWESAAPLHAAELKAGEKAVPNWDGDYYAIAVYGVPGITRANEKNLQGELRQTSLLKRHGKKDLKPARVDIALLGDNTARILYLFPRTAEITLDDGRVEFVSQIGRIYLGPSFTIADMTFQGKLEL